MSKKSKTSPKIALRYALAIYEIGEKNNNQKILESQLTDIEKFIHTEKDFKKIIISPLLNAVNQEDIIMKVFSGNDKFKLEKNIMSFLLVLGRNGRLSYLEAIIKSYNLLMSKKRNEQEVFITSAVSLEENVKEEIKLNLSKKIRKEVLLSHKIDPDILGGIVMQIGSQMIDCSTKYKFIKLKQAMKGAS